MICSVIPYEGKEPYVFLSYCHKDRDRVYPLLEQMVRDGYRVWYDDGNHAGDDWLENIANHLNNCKVCLAMISEKSANSHNCRNEISFAIECKKKVLAVLLENFSMPIGMKLQLGTIHYVKKQDYPSEHMLLSKLYETAALAECKTTPGSLPMRENHLAPEKEAATSGRSATVSGFIGAENVIPRKNDATANESDGSSTDRATSEGESVGPANGNQKKVIKAKVRVRGDLQNRKETEHISADVPTPQNKVTEDDDEPETVFDGETRFDAEDDGDENPTVWANQQSTALVIRLSSGEAFALQSALTRIGRSPKRCEIVLADNGYIGNCHAEIIQYNNQYYLHDLGSTNGTFVNDKKLSSEERVELHCDSQFRLHNESFLFIDDDRAGQIISGNRLYYLRCITTQGMKILQKGDLLLDRSHKWEDGTLNDEKISRNNKHAMITNDGGKLSLQDLGSRNGTFVNGTDIRRTGAVQLLVGDQIRLGDTILEVSVIALQGEGK